MPHLSPALAAEPSLVTDALPSRTLPALLVALLDEVHQHEKPSGSFRAGEAVRSHCGSVLSPRPRDPKFFLGGAGMTPAHRDALCAANSATRPTADGLTWRDFSRARGYTEREIARYGLLLDTLELLGWSFPDLAEAADAPSAYDLLCTPAGREHAAAVLTCVLEDALSSAVLARLATRLVS